MRLELSDPDEFEEVTALAVSDAPVMAGVAAAPLLLSELLSAEPFSAEPVSVGRESVR
ncbi:MAG: hypothetical protein ACRCSP_04670 [Rhodoglobus sp.]